MLSPNSVIGATQGDERHRPVGSIVADSPILTWASREIASVDPGLSRRLDDCADRGVMSLHGRSVPGYGAVIAEIAVGPSGVYVIDVKHCRKNDQAHGHSLSSSRRLAPKSLLSDRERTRIVTKMAWQMEVVRSVLDGLTDARVGARTTNVGAGGCQMGDAAHAASSSTASTSRGRRRSPSASRGVDHSALRPLRESPSDWRRSCHLCQMVRPCSVSQ